jgi:hypothetical protein
VRSKLDIGEGEKEINHKQKSNRRQSGGQAENDGLRDLPDIVGELLQQANNRIVFESSFHVLIFSVSFHGIRSPGGVIGEAMRPLF